MNYFRLKESLNEKEIGKYPQSISTDESVKIDAEGHLNQYVGRKTDTRVKLPVPILRGNAKFTDLISCVSFSLNFLVSEKLKAILCSFNSDDFDFLETQMIHNNKLLTGWVIHPNAFDMSAVDFEASDIWRTGLGGKELKKEIIKTEQEFNDLKNSLKWPDFLCIKSLVLRKDINQKMFFTLSPVYGGVGFYVSEIVRQKIVEAQCTGIVFEDIAIGEK